MIARRTVLKSLPLLLSGAASLSRASTSSAPITFVAPGSAGTASDQIARFMAREVGANMSRSIVVENKPGAGNVIGTEYVARSTPDGKTVLITSANHYATPWVHHLNFDIEHAFTPIWGFGNSTLVVLVGPKSPYTNMKEVIAAAKANPNALSFMSAGSGTLSHICGELVNSMAHIDIRHVPYKSSSQGLLDVSSGVVSLSYQGIAGPLPLIKSGRLKAIAVTGATRSIYLPDVPTVAESALPGYDITAPLFALAPTGTPASALNPLSKAFEAAAASEAFKKFCATQGLEPTFQSRTELVQAMPDEFDRWHKLVKLAGAAVA